VPLGAPFAVVIMSIGWFVALIVILLPDPPLPDLARLPPVPPVPLVRLLSPPWRGWCRSCRC
jgi:hypothetical protein